MPHPIRQPCCLLAFALAALGACRPGDAPKEPTEPGEPTVLREAAPSGGIGLAFARRGQALTKL